MEEISVSNAKKRLKTKSKSTLVNYIISLLQEQNDFKKKLAELESKKCQY